MASVRSSSRWARCVSANASAVVLPRPGSRRPWLVLEAVLLLAILGASLPARLHDLEGPRGGFPDLYDEGIEAQQLLLVSNGFRPSRDIYDPDGTLKLVVLYPFYALFGQTLGAARLGVGLLSLLGLLGIWWTARQAAGALGGLAAVVLLAASPAYLEASRLLLAEVPSLTPCLWAIGCGIRWLRGGGPGWLYGAAVLATVGVLVKLSALPVAVPLGLLVLLRPGVRPRQVAIALGLALGITAGSVLIMGPAEVYEQVVQYRLGARQGGWELRHNFKKVLAEPFAQQPGLFILAAAGGLLLINTNWRSGLALTSWLVATTAVLLVHTPLHPKHLANLYPPLALVGGAGFGRAVWLAWKEGPSGRPVRLTTLMLAGLLLAFPLGAVPVASGNVSHAEDAEDPDLNVFDHEASETVALLTGPRDFVLTDHPYIAVLARRMTPPKLDGVSLGLIRAGRLTDRDIIGMAQQYDTRLVLTWSDRLRRLAAIPPWLDRNYVLVQAFGNRNVKTPRGAKDRSVYLRRDPSAGSGQAPSAGSGQAHAGGTTGRQDDWSWQGLAASREVLERSLELRETADFEGQLRLLGVSLSSSAVAAGEQITFTFGWLGLAPMSTDYHLTVQLIGSEGDSRHAQEHDLEGSVRGTSTWEPGRWLFRTFAVRPERDTPPGEYRLQVTVTDPKSGLALRPTPVPNANQLREEQPGRLTVARLRVS
jgi:hypothetical protein